jgi:dihydroorotate dehydrogenase
LSESSIPEDISKVIKDPLAGPYFLAGHELQAPLLNAAGSLSGTSKENILHEADELIASQVGALTFGSLTIPWNRGLGAWHYDPVTRQMFNRMKFPNIGTRTGGKKVISELATRTSFAGVPLIVSGAPLINWKLGTTLDQLKKLAYELLGTKADLVELDISCLNLTTPGGWVEPSPAYNLYRMTELMEGLKREVGYTDRLGFKLPSYLDKSAEGWGIRITGDHDEAEKPLIPELAKLLRACRVASYLVISNSLGNQIPSSTEAREIFKDFPNNSAGLSGPSERVKIIARQQLDKWTSEFEDDEQMDIVSAQGLDSGREMAYRLKLGAAAVEGVSFLWRTDKMKDGRLMTLGERVAEMLEQFADEVETQSAGQPS